MGISRDASPGTGRIEGVASISSHLTTPRLRMRVRGHHVFNRRGLTSPINLQDIAGNAKEYQVRQVRRILLEQGLTSIKGDRDGD